MPGEATQLEMDFHGPVGDGYANWLRDQQEALKRIAAVWELPLGRRVRLRLHNVDSEFVGKLSLAQVPLSLDRRRPLTLRLPPLEFSSTEIEYCAVMEEEGG